MVQFDQFWTNFIMKIFYHTFIANMVYTGNEMIWLPKSARKRDFSIKKGGVCSEKEAVFHKLGLTKNLT